MGVEWRDRGGLKQSNMKLKTAGEKGQREAAGRGGRDGGKVTIYTAHFPQSRSKSFTLRGARGLT